MKRFVKCVTVAFGICGIGVGVMAWAVVSFKAENDLDKCILQMSTTQKIVFSHSVYQELNIGDKITFDDLIAADFLQEAYRCPSGGKYTALGKVPDDRTVYLMCDQKGHVLDLDKPHVPRGGLHGVPSASAEQ